MGSLTLQLPVVCSQPRALPRGLRVKSWIFLSSFLVPPLFLLPQFGCVFLLKAAPPTRQPSSTLEFLLQVASGSAHSSFKLGLIQPLSSWAQVLHHPLLVSLNPTHPFGNNTELLLNFSPPSHGRKPCVSCQDPQPHFSWCNMMFSPHAFPEELNMLSASWMAVLASRWSLCTRSWRWGMLCSKRKACEPRWVHWSQSTGVKSMRLVLTPQP